MQARATSAIVSIPEWWNPQHVEAYRAWKHSDWNRLIKVCAPEIRKLARGLAVASRRGRSDELRQLSQHDRFNEDRKKEAALTQDGLREAREVAEFDDLYQAGCEAVLDTKQRYDPERKAVSGIRLQTHPRRDARPIGRKT
jgi:hypothetical protein